MIMAERGTPKPWRYDKSKLVGQAFHKYVIHNLRHGQQTEKRIRAAIKFLEENTSAFWMAHIMDYTSSALFWVADDQDAMLFELGSNMHPGDKRGQKVWG